MYDLRASLCLLLAAVLSSCSSEAEGVDVRASIAAYESVRDLRFPEQVASDSELHVLRTWADESVALPAALIQSLGAIPIDGFDSASPAVPTPALVLILTKPVVPALDSVVVTAELVVFDPDAGWDVDGPGPVTLLFNCVTECSRRGVIAYGDRN